MRSALVGVVGVIGTLALAVAANPALAAPPPERMQAQLALPMPTGPHDIGKRNLLLVDHTRRDPWVPESGDRELLVSLWYPAALPIGRPATYMTASESALLLEARGVTGVDPALLSTTRTHARLGAPPLPRAGGRPLVVLSPGFTLSRTSQTALAEDLASKGYLVAAIDHTYESVGTEFPDGRVTTCVACGAGVPWPQTVQGRVADVSFVLDELAASGLGALVDWSRVGIAGHSLGGATAAETILADDRVRAGVNLDGTFQPRLPESGLSAPFMMIGTEVNHSPGGLDDSWNEGWHRLTGWKRWLTVSDTGHFWFCDLPHLANQAGLTFPEAPMPGSRAIEIYRAYVGAFFDQHLRGRSRPLLDGPSERYPEVRFW